MKYRFTENYASNLGTWSKGDEVDFDATTAAWLQRDVEGVIEPAEKSAEPEPIPAPAQQPTPDYDRILDRPAIVDPASLKEQEHARREAVAIAPPGDEVDLDVIANDGSHPAQQDADVVVEEVIADAETEEEKLEDAASDAESDEDPEAKKRQQTTRNTRQVTGGKNRSA